MPRYFLTTASQHLKVRDDEGVDVSGDEALNELICKSLAEMFAAEVNREKHQSFSVYASDESGDEVVKATLKLVVRSRQNA